MTGESLEGAQRKYEQLRLRERRQRFMLLQLDPAARAGEPRPIDEVLTCCLLQTVYVRCAGSCLPLHAEQACHTVADMLHAAQIPIYAHVKEVVDPLGRREALEVNYMKFLAYNGSYKVFGFIPAGNLGAHDAGEQSALADQSHVFLMASWSLIAIQ